MRTLPPTVVKFATSRSIFEDAGYPCSIADNFLNRWSRKTDLAIRPFPGGAILVQIEYSPSLTRVNHY